MKKILLVIIPILLTLSIFTSSCGKKDESKLVTNYKLDKWSMMRFIERTNEVGTSSGITGDKDYALPTLDWVQHDFYSALSKFKFDLAVSYKGSANDCDDFARMAAFYADYLYSNSSGRMKDTSLAFGEFWYVKDSGKGHCINVFVYYEDNKLKLGFFEPQTGEVIKLSEAEKLQCEMYKF